MTHKFDGSNDFIRLFKGERLSEALTRFSNETNIDGGWINGLGASAECELGFYDLTNRKYNYKKFTDLMEVVSLQGNFALNEEGKTVFHLHGVFADKDYKTVGGHVKDLVAGATLELFVHRAYEPLNRRLDEETGIQALDL